MLFKDQEVTRLQLSNSSINTDFEQNMKEMQSKIKSFQNIVRSKDNEIRDLLDQSLK